jgi:hypothetical protein
MERTTITHLLTREQAIAFVKKVDRENSGHFCLRVRLDARIEGNPDRIFPDALFSYLNISRKEALRLVSDMLSPTMEARGARITIDETKFVDAERPTYWIG